MIRPEFCILSTSYGFELATAGDCQSLIVSPAVARCHFIGQILDQVSDITALRGCALALQIIVSRYTSVCIHTR
jgi:hypothetical protein